MKPNVLLITPPFTQLNTPYPATSYLKGFLDEKGVPTQQCDLSIELFNGIFTSHFIEKVFKEAKKNNSNEFPLIFTQKKGYIDKVDIVKHFLQQQEVTTAHLILNDTFLPKAHRFEALEEDLYTIDSDGEHVTQLVNGQECAFVFFDEKGITKCSIEQAYLDKKTNFKKPISCHLFPVRLTKYKNFTAVNYAHWDICDDACKLGDELGVQTYRFLKEPLIRKFGREWFEELELVDKHLNKSE